MAPPEFNALVNEFRTTQLNDLTVAAGFEECLVAAGLGSLDRLFACSSEQDLQKPGLSAWRERIRLTLTIEDEPTALYLKRYTNPPLAARRALRQCGARVRSLAGLEWTRMCQLAAAGIPCVEPVAFGEKLTGNREVRSAVLAKAVPGRSLEAWASEWTGADRQAVCQAADASAVIVARLHGSGFIHRDLYLSHLFFHPEPADGVPIRIIDLQRVLHKPRFFRRWVVKDLASLSFSTPDTLFSTADRVRWLKRYLGIGKMDRAAKRLAYSIIGKTRRIARHDRRRRRRLGPSGMDAS